MRNVNDHAILGSPNHECPICGNNILDFEAAEIVTHLSTKMIAHTECVDDAEREDQISEEIGEDEEEDQ